MEGEEREALAMPVREEVDQLSAFQQLAEAPADDLGDAGARKASSIIDFGSVKVSGPLTGTSIVSSPRMKAQS